MKRAPAAIAFALTLALATPACADGHRGRRSKAAAAPLRAAGGLTAGEGDARYREECGSCHLAYPPGFLPAASWRTVMQGLDRHFGQNAELDPADAAALSAWLQANAAEAGTHRRSAKLLRSVREGPPPLRVSEVPYISRKHDEVKRSVWKRPSIGSRANCAACHREAEKGTFDEDTVKIPKE